jgi:integrase
MLGIVGRSLHSYRYAWAQRARAAGMPEREAMNHLGHESRAIHAAYAGGAQVAVLPLEFYEAQKEEKVIQFKQVAQQAMSKQDEEKVSHG